MQFDDILVERRGGAGLITLNRPRVLNALSPHLIEEVGNALDGFDADPEVGAAVLTGGPQVFAAGADIADMVERTAVEQLLRDQTASWARVSDFTKPLIAAVNGYALGGGCELALMCDLVVAGEGAAFGQPEINLGIIPGAGGTQRWARTAGKQVAMEMVLFGDRIGADRAHQLGVVNRVVPAETTIDVAVELAQRLAAKAPLAVRLGKRAVNRALEMPLAQGLETERDAFYMLFASEDQKEGMRAFLEKRKPTFGGR
jgi:enoyl-CoA hydratase